MNKTIGELYCNQLHDVLKITGIFTIHSFKYSKHFEFNEEAKDFWEILFVDSGDAISVSGEKRTTIKPLQVIFHKPNIPHSIITGDSDCNSIIISFSVTGRTMSFFEDRAFTLNDYEQELLQKVVLEGKKAFKGKLNLSQQKKMEKRIDAPFATEQIIRNNLELLLISIIRSNTQKKSAKKLDVGNSARSEQIVKSIIDILNRKISSSVNLDDISSQLYFSKTYIKTVFKKHTGTSIIQYFNNLKIEEAKQLIATDKYSFTEIAEKLGFSSVHYFTRLFKSVTETTPTEYQKSLTDK